MYVIGQEITIKGSTYVIERIHPLRLGKGGLTEHTAIASLTVRKPRGTVLYDTVLHVNDKLRGLVAVSRLSAIQEAPSRQPDAPGGIVAFLSESRIDGLFSILMWGKSRVNTPDETLVTGLLDELHIQSGRLFAFSADEFKLIVQLAGEYLEKVNPRALRPAARWFANGFAADPDVVEAAARYVFDDNAHNVQVTFDGTNWHLDVVNRADGKTQHQQALGSTYGQAVDALGVLFDERQATPPADTGSVAMVDNDAAYHARRSEIESEQYIIRLSGAQLDLARDILSLEIDHLDYTYDTEEEIADVEARLDSILEVLDNAQEVGISLDALNHTEVGLLCFYAYDYIQRYTGKKSEAALKDDQRLNRLLLDRYEQIRPDHDQSIKPSHYKSTVRLFHYRTDGTPQSSDYRGYEAVEFTISELNYAQYLYYTRHRDERGNLVFALDGYHPVVLATTDGTPVTAADLFEAVLGSVTYSLTVNYWETRNDKSENTHARHLFTTAVKLVEGKVEEASRQEIQDQLEDFLALEKGDSRLRIDWLFSQIESAAKQGDESGWIAHEQFTRHIQEPVLEAFIVRID